MRLKTQHKLPDVLCAKVMARFYLQCIKNDCNLYRQLKKACPWVFLANEFQFKIYLLVLSDGKKISSTHDVMEKWCSQTNFIDIKTVITFDMYYIIHDFILKC